MVLVHAGTVSRNRLCHIQSCDHGGVAVCLPCIHVVKAFHSDYIFYFTCRQTTSPVLHLPQNGVSLLNNGAIAAFFFLSPLVKSL